MTALRRLIDLPGFADLETRALMKPAFADPEARAEFPEIDALARDTFGLTADEAAAMGANGAGGNRAGSAGEGANGGNAGGTDPDSLDARTNPGTQTLVPAIGGGGGGSSMGGH